MQQLFCPARISKDDAKIEGVMKEIRKCSLLLAELRMSFQFLMDEPSRNLNEGQLFNQVKFEVYSFNLLFRISRRLFTQ